MMMFDISLRKEFSKEGVSSSSLIQDAKIEFTTDRFRNDYGSFNIKYLAFTLFWVWNLYQISKKYSRIKRKREFVLHYFLFWGKNSPQVL